MFNSSRELEPVRPSPVTKSWSLLIFLPACALLLAIVGIASPTFARSIFDGEWSVIIETRDGLCPPTVRYPVIISNGIVSNAGNALVTVTGQVTPTGIVRVTVQSGGAWASGAGRLSATNGAGVWQGQSSSGACGGIWQAERRIIERSAPTYGYPPPGSRPYYPGYRYPDR